MVDDVLFHIYHGRSQINSTVATVNHLLSSVVYFIQDVLMGVAYGQTNRVLTAKMYVMIVVFTSSMSCVVDE